MHGELRMNTLGRKRGFDPAEVLHSKTTPHSSKTKKSNISTQTSLVRHAAAPFPVFFERENPVKHKTKTAKHKRAVYVLDLSGHLQRLSALMK